MNDKRSAQAIRDRSLRVVAQLSQILALSRDQCSEMEFDHIKKGVGLAIAHVQTEILDMIYARYPDLNDLK